MNCNKPQINSLTRVTWWRCLLLMAVGVAAIALGADPEAEDEEPAAVEEPAAEAPAPPEPDEAAAQPAAAPPLPVNAAAKVAAAIRAADASDRFAFDRPDDEELTEIRSQIARIAKADDRSGSAATLTALLRHARGPTGNLEYYEFPAGQSIPLPAGPEWHLRRVEEEHVDRLWLRVFGARWHPEIGGGTVTLHESRLRLDRPGLYLLSADDGERLAAGWICRADLQVTALGDGAGCLLLVSDGTGQAVPQAEIYAVAGLGFDADEEPERVFTAVTGADGVAALRLDPPAGATAIRLRLVARAGARLAFVTAQLPLPATTSRRQVHVAAERPLYRPGEVAKLRAVVRSWHDGVLEPHAGKKLTLVVSPPHADPVWVRRLEVTTDAFGACATEVPLPVGAPLGTWSWSWEDPQRIDGATAPAAYRRHWRDANRAAGGAAFRVEEFRAPSHEATLEAARTVWRRGETIELTATVRALSGEPLAAAGWLWPVDSHLRLPVRTGPDGICRLRLAETLLPERTHRLALEFPDPAGGIIRASCRVELESSSAVRRLSVHRWREWLTPAEGVAVVVTLTDLEGAPATGRVRVCARLEQTPTVIEVPVLEQTVAVAGTAVVRFAAPVPGTWGVWAESEGCTYRRSDNTTNVYVAGQGDGELRLRPDRTEYRVGDVAEVAVAGPAGPALVVVDAGGIIERHAVDLSRGPALLRLPVLTHHAPGFHLLAVAIAGGKVQEATATLPLATPEAPLRVELTVPPGAKPGDEIEVGIQVFADPDQRIPDQRIPGRVALAVVDEALYRLQEDFAPPLADAFPALPRDPRARLSTEHRERYWYREEPAEVLKEDLGRWLTSDADGKLRVAARTDHGSLHRFGGHASYGGRSASGAVAPSFADSVRRDLRHDAYWNPAVDTDDEGRATVTFRLPQNLTAWRVTARVATRDRRAGEARVTLAATQPLRLRLHHPRVLRPGELTTLRAHLSGDVAGPATLEWQLAGLTAKGPRQITLELNGAAAVDLPIVVGTAATATVRLRAACGGATDALDLELPVEPPGVEVRWNQAGPVTGHRELRLDALPRGVTGQLVVRLEAGPLAALDAALAQVREYPYGCVEQSVSRFLPAALLARALPRERWTARPEDADVAGLILAGRTRLAALRQSDGAWGWWPHSRPQLWLTAYARLALALTREGPAPERDRAQDRQLATLLAEPLLLDELTGAAVPAAADTADLRAEALADWHTLVGDGEYDLSAALLWLQAAALDGTLDAKAMAPLAAQAGRFAPVERLLFAAALAASDRPAATQLAAAALDQLQQLAPGGRGLASDPAIAAALALYAGVALAPAHPQVERLLGQVLAGRRGGVWPTTLASSLSLAALAEWLRQHPAAAATVAWRATLAGRELPLPAAAPGAALVITREVRSGERLTVAGNGWLDAEVRWRAATAPPLADGLKLERRLWRRTWGPLGEPRREPLEPGAPLRGGERLEIELRLTTATPLAEVGVEAPNASGLEPLVADSGVPHGPATNREVRRTHLAFFLDRLPAGTTTLTWECVAELPGRPTLPPAEAWCMYRPAIRARCAAVPLRLEPAAPAPLPVQELTAQGGEQLVAAVVARLEQPDDHGDVALAELLLALDTDAGRDWLRRGLPGIAGLDDALAGKLLVAWLNLGRHSPPTPAERLALPLPRAVLVHDLRVCHRDTKDRADWRRQLHELLALLEPAERATAARNSAADLGELTIAAALAYLDDVPPPERLAFAAGLVSLEVEDRESQLARARRGEEPADLAAVLTIVEPVEILLGRLAADGRLARRLLPKLVSDLSQLDPRQFAEKKLAHDARTRLAAAHTLLLRTAVTAHGAARLNSVREVWASVFTRCDPSDLVPFTVGAARPTRHCLAATFAAGWSHPAQASLGDWLAAEDDDAIRDLLVDLLPRAEHPELPLARLLELRDRDPAPRRQARLLELAGRFPEARPALVAALAASAEEAAVAIRLLDEDATPAERLLPAVPRLHDARAITDALRQVCRQRLGLPCALALDALARAGAEPDTARGLGEPLGAWLDDAGADLALARLSTTDAYGAQLAMAEALAPHAARLEAPLRALLARADTARPARLALALGGRPVPGAELLEQFAHDLSGYGRELAARALLTGADAEWAARLCAAAGFPALPEPLLVQALTRAGAALPADVAARLAPAFVAQSAALAALVLPRLDAAGLTQTFAAVLAAKDGPSRRHLRELAAPLPPASRALLTAALGCLSTANRARALPLLAALDPEGAVAGVRDRDPWVAAAASRAAATLPAANGAVLAACATHPRLRQLALRQLARSLLEAEREAHDPVRREEAAAAWFAATDELVSHRDAQGVVRRYAPWDCWWWEP